MRVTELNQGWLFRTKDAGPGYYRPHHPDNLWRDAVVPGHVHLDLVRQGMIVDPFIGEAEAGCQWVDQANWSYRTTFEWSPDPTKPNRKLLFEGLDTVCKIYLNDDLIAAHDNMFVPLEVDVSAALREGDNVLQVEFESAVRVGDERRSAYFQKEGLRHDTTFFDERAFVRKVQCMSGWDWGPRLVSCGIWKPVKLLEYSERVTEFRVQQEQLADGKFRIWTTTQIEGEASYTTQLSGFGVFTGDLDVILDDPILWQPNGYGEPHLYEVSVSLGKDHAMTRKIGLRTIELRREPDRFGESFTFVVNGQEIWARGANWIPNDAFPSRISAGDYESQVKACSQLNMNMLRVWGGGLYESEAFYDACDANGILVWQDFPFACSYYPDNKEFQETLRVEASYQICRLRDRTCLALWCGNNENEWMWQTRWGDDDKIPPRYYGQALYEDLLPSLIAQFAPGQPYIPTSPTGQNPSDEKGTVNDGSHGDQHYWDAWHGRGDWKYYGDSTARFSSEFGFASSCSAKAWKIAGVDVEETSPDHPAVRWHDRTRKPWETFKGFVELHYPTSDTLKEWIHTSQLNQRDALRFAIEHYRRSEFCKGTLIWQFNDCWPVQSWAVQDYAREMKLAGWELQRLYAPILIAAEMAESLCRFFVINDSQETVHDTLSVEVLCIADSQVIQKSESAFKLGPNRRDCVYELDLSGWDVAAVAIRASLSHAGVGERWSLCAEPKDIDWPSRTGAEIFNELRP
ncbi:MAG: hypothetical protein KF784_14750 [Fimbriimonadaceae bacterium]|nr:hypothetical protein [Fimbriimonadaceae bacterium]